MPPAALEGRRAGQAPMTAPEMLRARLLLLQSPRAALQAFRLPRDGRAHGGHADSTSCGTTYWAASSPPPGSHWSLLIRVSLAFGKDLSGEASEGSGLRVAKRDNLNN